jgi:hypothetical protein
MSVESTYIIPPHDFGKKAKRERVREREREREFK